MRRIDDMTVEPTGKASRSDESEMDSSVLVQRIQVGDARAEEVLVARYSLGLEVMRSSRSFGHDPALDTLLPPGDYELRVEGGAADGAPNPIARFALRVDVGF